VLIGSSILSRRQFEARFYASDDAHEPQYENNDHHGDNKSKNVSHVYSSGRSTVVMAVRSNNKQNACVPPEGSNLLKAQCSALEP
jgi:hypothetical protein